MTPIPEAAMPIVEILRRDVPRPEELPVLTYGALRWPIIDDSEEQNGISLEADNLWGADPPLDNVYCFCPLGLLPGEANAAPHFIDPNCPKTRLMMWWDELPAADAAKAVDAIWGPE